MNIEDYLQTLESEIQKENDTLEKDAAMQRMADVLKLYRGDDRVVSSLELWEEIKNAPPEMKMMTGFPEFDRILDGFRIGQLVVLSGVTKHGKTTMAVEFTVRLKEYNPMWLSFEEPAVDIVRKFAERNQEPPLFYTPRTMKQRNLAWVEERIVESKVKYDSKVVVIDHLGFLQDDGKYSPEENMSYKIERIVRALKTLAIKLDVCIILLAHLTKTKIDATPSLDELKGSSAIAQEADTVLLLWRKTKRTKKEIIITNEAKLSVQANRRTGRTGNIEFLYIDGRYVETEWTDDGTAQEVW